MTPQEERQVFDRLLRLEAFASKVTRLLGAAGQVLDAGRLIEQSTRWTGQEPEKERDRERG